MARKSEHMPVISRTKICIERNEYNVEIICGSDGMFKIKLPNEISQKCGQEFVLASRKSEAVKAFKDKIEEVSAAMVKIDKRIWYRIGTHLGDFKSDRTFHDENTMRIGVGFRVVIRYNYLNNVYLFDAADFEKNGVKAEKISYHYSGWKDVNWTAEREAFFIRFTDRLSEMIARLDEFAENQDVLMLLIDSGKDHLLTEAPKNEKVIK